MKNSLSGNEKGSRRKQVILLTAAALAEVVCLIGLAFFIRTNTLLALILALSFQIPLVVRMFTENRRVKILCRILSVLLLTAGLIAFLGCILSLDTVWTLSDICNGLMAVPNLICVLLLSKGICKEIREWEE